MFNYALIFLIIALLAAVLGLGSLAGMAMYAAKLLLVVFVIVFLVQALSGKKLI